MPAWHSSVGGSLLFVFWQTLWEPNYPSSISCNLFANEVGFLICLVLSLRASPIGCLQFYLILLAFVCVFYFPFLHFCLCAARAVWSGFFLLLLTCFSSCSPFLFFFSCQFPSFGVSNLALAYTGQKLYIPPAHPRFSSQCSPHRFVRRNWFCPLYLEPTVVPSPYHFPPLFVLPFATFPTLREGFIRFSLQYFFPLLLIRIIFSPFYISFLSRLGNARFSFFLRHCFFPYLFPVAVPPVHLVFFLSGKILDGGNFFLYSKFPFVGLFAPVAV